MPRKINKNETRKLEQIKDHYDLEKELANKLRNSDKEMRKVLYTELYDQLFQQVPEHPTVVKKNDLNLRCKHVSQQMALIKKFIIQRGNFLEIGAGSCALTLEVAKFAHKVYAVDVSNEITKGEILPQNFRLIISDGSSIPVPKNSIDFIYSNQLMEHLHPDDAMDQLRNIYNALAPGGIYICSTPNRLTGPHDVSRYFDNVATGFHLKEYTVTELCNLLMIVGFNEINYLAGGRGIFIRFPLSLITLFESVLIDMPFSLRTYITDLQLSKALFGITLVARKPKLT